MALTGRTFHKLLPQYRVASALSLSSQRCFGGELKENARTKDYFSHYQGRMTVPRSNDFDPNDTKTAFQSMSTYQLIKYNVMFSLLGVEPLPQAMIKIMTRPKQNTAPPKPKKKSNSLQIVCFYVLYTTQHTNKCTVSYTV